MRSILKLALKLLSVRGAWIQRMDAADKNGEETAPGDKTACRWCINGAIMEAGYRLHAKTANKLAATDAMELAVGQATHEDDDSVAYNDARGRRKGQVLDVLRSAIKDSTVKKEKAIG